MSSVLNMTNKEIHLVACDKFGSWAIQKLLANKNIDKKKLNTFYDKFKVNYTEIIWFLFVLCFLGRGIHHTRLLCFRK